MAEVRSVKAIEVRIPFDEDDPELFDVVQATPVVDHYSTGGGERARWRVGNPCAGTSLIVYPSEIDYYIELFDAMKNYYQEED